MAGKKATIPVEGEAVEIDVAEAEQIAGVAKATATERDEGDDGAGEG